MTQLINQVLVVGGGTAGWLTAAILAQKLDTKSDGAVKVTLVESPDVPIIGVGEGTWPTLRNTLEDLGIDEGEFLRECDATFKQGSEFVNWVHPPHGEDHSYYHPLSAVFHSAHDFNLAPYWMLGDAGPDIPYDEAVATQTRMCQRGLAPKLITTPAYQAIQNYSYHLNAHKFALFLKNHCVDKLGVTFISANVTGVELDDEGAITSVDTDRAGRLQAGMFVDCTGSRALLLGDALGVGWHNVGDVLFNDSALAMQVPYDDPKAPIATHTIATAQEAGWIWDIGLHNRRGVGHVYSSRYTDDTTAEAALRAHIGPAAEGLEAKKLRFDLGYREKFWHKNCVAMGMSAAFVEPLEASAIFLIDAGAKMIADQFPRTREAMAYVEDKYNDTMRLRWEKTIDFIKLHYCISKRRDSQYWIDNCKAESIPPSLAKRLAHWKSHPPSKYDFDYAYEPFVLDSYLFVLYGMRYDASIGHNQSAFSCHREAKILFAEIDKTTAQLSQKLPSQRELIDKIYQYGTSSI